MIHCQSGKSLVKMILSQRQYPAIQNLLPKKVRRRKKKYHKKSISDKVIYLFTEKKKLSFIDTDSKAAFILPEESELRLILILITCAIGLFIVSSVLNVLVLYQWFQSIYKESVRRPRMPIRIEDKGKKIATSDYHVSLNSTTSCFQNCVKGRLLV